MEILIDEKKYEFYIFFDRLILKIKIYIKNIILIKNYYLHFNDNL